MTTNQKRSMLTWFSGINVENVVISGSVVPLLALLVVIILFCVMYISHTGVGFRLRKWFPANVFAKTLQDYKGVVRILFIDDRDIPIANTLQDDGWTVERVRDAKIDDSKVRDANIIFVDWKGTGTRIDGEQEGIALVDNLKRRYRSKKYVILYSTQEYNRPAGTLADDWINKGSKYDAYLERIQKGAFVLFS